jgi:DNA repair photolyase
MAVKQNHNKGRGATINPDGRFESQTREVFDDGWGSRDDEVAPLKTTLSRDQAKTVINYNNSPDVPFDRSINPYRGCEHGCVYCFARPSHSYLGLSAGLDFETKLFYKNDAASKLTRELAKSRYACQPITLGINTDAYQPVERKLKHTRSILEVLAGHKHPVTIVTKSALIERDIDILSAMAQQNLASVAISITTLDRSLARSMEPRAAAPQRRLQTIEALAKAGIPVGVLVAPVIPVLSDPEMESIIEQASRAGAQFAGYVLLRLPHEVKDLFKDWLNIHFPQKAAHVMNRVRDTRGGKEYDSTFGVRMRGAGWYAELIQKRFRLACKKFELNKRNIELDCAQFSVPAKSGDQLALF